MARIILVDDEIDNRNMLRDALVRKGHEVVVAGDAREAMALPPKPPFEVAIIDYVLPGMKGLSLLNQLRKKYSSIRSIIISGQIDDDILRPSVVEDQLREKTLADRYLPKPFSTEALVSAIEEVMTGPKSGQVNRDKIPSGAVKKINKVLKKGRKKNQ